MVYDAHANLATTTITVPPSPALSGTQVTVKTGTAARFPTPPFNAAVCASNVIPDPTNTELVRVTAVTGDILTVVRNAEPGGTLQTVVAGWRVTCTTTAKVFTDIEAAVTAETARASAAEVLLAPLASPALTGSPTAPTPGAGDNTTKVATTAYVDRAATTTTGGAVGLAIALGG